MNQNLLRIVFNVKRGLRMVVPETNKAIGVGGPWSKLSYDFFMGAPISKPQGYRTARVTLGVNLNASF